MLMIIVGTVILIDVFLLMSSPKGIGNRYSGTILLIINILICAGCAMIDNDNYIGVVLVFLAIPFIMGFRTIQGSDPRNVGLITYFNKRTKTRVEGLTLVLNWPIDIIGVVEYSMELTNINFTIDNIRSYDGVRMTGEISIAVEANEERLDKWDDVRGVSGVTSMLHQTVPSWLQDIGRQVGHDWKWMERETLIIQRMLLDDLKNGGKLVDNDDTLLNIAEMGVNIKKISIKLTPIDPEMIAADEDDAKEILQRKAEVRETATIIEQAQLKLKAYQDYCTEKPGTACPTLQQCRDEVLIERLAKRDKVSVTSGGQIINLKNLNTSQ